MKHQPVIQKFLVSLLLVIFSISIAPKAYFHDLVANHKDLVGCEEKHSSSALHKQEINCHFDDLVVSAPFVSGIDQLPSFAPLFFEEEQRGFYSSSFQSCFQHKENRGPPSI